MSNKNSLSGATLLAPPPSISPLSRGGEKCFFLSFKHWRILNNDGHYPKQGITSLVFQRPGWWDRSNVMRVSWWPRRVFFSHMYVRAPPAFLFFGCHNNNNATTTAGLFSTLPPPDPARWCHVPSLVSPFFSTSDVWNHYGTERPLRRSNRKENLLTGERDGG